MIYRLFRTPVTMFSILVLLLLVALGGGRCCLAQQSSWQDRPVTGRSEIVDALTLQYAQAEDVGLASGNEILAGFTVLIKQSVEQKDTLMELLAEQQTPGSGRYRRWLTPSEYTEKFGSPSESVTRAVSWLTAEGFTGISLSGNHSTISFSGRTSQIEEAFSTQIHRYRVQNREYLGNTTPLSIPRSMVSYVQEIRGPHQSQLFSRSLPRRISSTPQWSSADNARHFVTPSDVLRIYDFAPLTASGYTGKGQTIAIVGQSDVDSADLARFRAAAGLSVLRFSSILVPGTGVSIRRPGDEFESDLDLEYASAVAPDSTVILVHTGSDTSYNVFDALLYAIEQNIAPIISISYGMCEADISEAEIEVFERALIQASAQGISIFAASGDLGATACESKADTIAKRGLAVWYPASSRYVTAIGGTMFDEVQENSFWSAHNDGADGSSLAYIPEKGWNETGTTKNGTILGSGGGASILFVKPAWQSGFGVPSDFARDVPDFAFDAGSIHDSYLFCSSDPVVPVQNSCAHGFLDGSSTNFTVSGGTSFGAPIAAGMAAVINQRLSLARSGAFASFVYTLATRNREVFHDITSGDNRQPCSFGSDGCGSDGYAGFVAGPGYDQVTGLGTPDAAKLANALAGANSESAAGQSPLLAAFRLKSSPVDTHLPDTIASVITVIPGPFYTGEVAFSLTSDNPALLSGGCYSIPNAMIESDANARSLLLIAFSNTGCRSLRASQNGNVHGFHSSTETANASRSYQPAAGERYRKERFTLGLIEACGVLYLTGVRRRARCNAAVLIAAFTVVPFISGCGTTVTTRENQAIGYDVILVGHSVAEPMATTSLRIHFDN